MAALMYFGNEEYMTWVPCPAVDMAVVPGNWITESQFLNGGAGVRRSTTGAKRYALEWNLTSPKNLDIVEQFYQGTWGRDSYFMFLDPAAMNTNVFPQTWAAPRVALDDGVKLVFDQKPTKAVTATQPGHPGVGAQYYVYDSSFVHRLVLPIPEGHKLVFECLQSDDGTGDAYLAYSMDGAAPVSAGTGATLTALPGGSIAKFSLYGEGAVSLFWVKGVIVPTGETPDLQYMSGRGNSGCEFVSFDRNVYSAAIGQGLEGATAELLEIGAYGYNGY